MTRRSELPKYLADAIERAWPDGGVEMIDEGKVLRILRKPGGQRRTICR